MEIKPYYIAHSFISEDYCEHIKKVAVDLKNTVEEFGGEEGRYTDVKQLPPCHIDDFEKNIYKGLKAVNKKHFGFALNYEPWPVGAFLSYPIGGFTNWHIDGGIGNEYPDRKLTCVIILDNQSDDFEGGDFEFPHYLNIPAEERLKIRKGTAIIFPSFMFHRVTTVTKGVRNTLTFFIPGPTLK